MTCFDIYRAFQHNEVLIGWRPYRTNQTTEIRTKPGCGNLVHTLDKGDGVGLQSARNPEGSSSPPGRLAFVTDDGTKYAWGYARSGSHTGWIKFDDLYYDPNPEVPPLKGPGGFDFECDRTEPSEKSGPGCGKISKTKPTRTVVVRDVYLRFSPRGTALHYLHQGDVVRLLLVDGPHGFAFCEVIQAASDGSATTGTRGWISHNALGVTSVTNVT